MVFDTWHFLRSPMFQVSSQKQPSQPTKTRRGADLFHRPKRWAVRKSENKDLLRHHIGLSQGQSPGKPPKGETGWFLTDFNNGCFMDLLVTYEHKIVVKKSLSWMARKGVGLKIIAGCGNCWGSRPFQGTLSCLMCGTNHLPCHLTLSIGETLSKHGNFWVNDHHVGYILGEDGALSEHLKREVLGTCFCCWSLMESVISTPNECQTPSPIKYVPNGIPEKMKMPRCCSSNFWEFSLP